MNLRLYTLGRAAAVVGDRTIEPSAELLFSAILFLAIERRDFAREELATMLWPDASHDRQGARLRWLLNKLRASQVPIESRATAVSLPAAKATLDFTTTDSLDPDAIGPVLPGYEPEMSPEFARWLSRARDRIASEAVRRLLPRLSAATRANDWDLVRRIAAAIHRVDPLNEEGVLALADAHCRTGFKAQALADLDAYLEALGDDRPELQLPATLLKRRIKLHTDATSRATDPPFVGRAEHLRRLTAMLDSARSGSGGVLMVTGPAGIGKSRVVNEAVERASISAMQIIHVRCQRDDVERPLSAFTEIIEQALGLRGAVGADPATYDRLRKFTSGGASDRQDGESPEVLRAQLSVGVLDLLDAAAAETPVIVVIDDIQWADSSLGPFWTRLARWTETHPVAVLCTARTPVPASLRELTALPLASLDESSAGRFIADALEAADRRANTGDVRALLARGGGSPLFLGEVVRQWALTGSTDSLPTSLTTLFDVGIARLGPSALRALEVAAILGSHATLERMERVMQTQRGTFIDAIVELENAGVIVTDARGNVSGHVLWADVALKRISESVAHVLHRHVAELFEVEMEAAPSAVLLWESARHWQGAGNPERARSAVIRGADHLAKQGFPEEAAKAYADMLAEVTDPHEQLSLLRRRIDHLHHAGAYDALEVAIVRHEKLASELNPGYDRHNDLEMLHAFIEMKQTGQVTTPLLRMMPCVRDTTATSAHRLRAAKEASRVAAFNDPGIFHELLALADSIPARTTEDVWNKDFIKYEYHAAFGDPLQAVAVVEKWLTEYTTASARRAAVLRMAGDAFWRAGRLGDARAALTEGLALNYKLGLVNGVVGAIDMLLSFVIEHDAPHVAHALVQEGKLLYAKLTKLGGLGEIARFANYEARLALAEGRHEEALRLVTPLEEALNQPVRRWRAHFLAIHLAARTALGHHGVIDEIGQGLEACFQGRNHWMDWPAAVLTEYLRGRRSIETATQFAVRYVNECRIELTQPPPIIRELVARAEGALALHG